MKRQIPNNEKLREELLRITNEDDIKAFAKILHAKALRGDVNALELILHYVVGPADGRGDGD